MRTRNRVPVLMFFCLTLLGIGARAQEEEPGKDHPRIPRMPGYVIANATETDFDAFDFDVPGETTKRVEGRSWSIDYGIKEGAKKASPLEMARNYLNQAKQKGGRSVFERVSSGGGSATMVMPGVGGGEVWIGLNINNNGEMYTLSIIETAAMQQKMEFSSDQMAEQLNSAGKLTLRGILFDTGKTDIKPESNALLDELAAMLKTNADLKLRIEGHTDNVGNKAANLQLSKGRAAAVKTVLVAREIAADRLTTEGFGDTKPVSDNATPDGRTQNRRVELVKQ